MTTSPTRTEPVGSGIVVLDKPGGWTSHQVVARVRRLAGTRKVGHAGTLDPMATGVLVLGIERATRLLGHLTLTDKDYRATVRFGISTVTDDAEGEVVAAPGAPGLTANAVAAGLPALTGAITQVPSAVSAIKVGGVRSYARVRAGEDVTLAARPVTVSRLELLASRRDQVDGTPVLDVDLAVTCSSGTYVRALARDLGGALGVGAHLVALRRTRVGPFDLAEAQTLAEAEDGLAVVDPASVARRCFPTLVLEGPAVAYVRHGRRLPSVALPGPLTALLDADDILLALYRPDGVDAVPVSVFVT